MSNFQEIVFTEYPFDRALVNAILHPISSVYSAQAAQTVGRNAGTACQQFRRRTRKHQRAAVLTAANIADELFKAQAAAEQLRSQIKGYLDEASKAQSEVSELKREIFRLQQRLDNRNKG